MENEECQKTLIVDCTFKKFLKGFTKFMLLHVQEVLDLVNLSGTFIPLNIDSDREGLLDY